MILISLFTFSFVDFVEVAKKDVYSRFPWLMQSSLVHTCHIEDKNGFVFFFHDRPMGRVRAIETVQPWRTASWFSNSVDKVPVYCIPFLPEIEGE